MSARFSYLNTWGMRVRGARMGCPAIMLLGSVWLLYALLFTTKLHEFSGVHTLYGPWSWPTFTLLMLIISIGLVLFQRAWQCVVGHKIEISDLSSEEEIDNTKVAAGGLLILLYGLGFVFLGFLLSSVLFMIIWMIYGGMRNPLKLVALSGSGTLVPLYILAKLAHMPLPLGVGVFETATVWLYRLLGIF